MYIQWNYQIDIDDNTKLSADDYRDRLSHEIKLRTKAERKKESEKAHVGGHLAAVWLP